MEYTEHVLDRRTGEFTEVSAGDWITVTELGDMKGVTARQVRTILREMEFLYVEGGRAHNRHRLMPWVIQQGLGRHIPAKPPKVRYPFDVIGPQGRTWIEASALTQTDGAALPLTASRMAAAGLVQMKGFGLSLCSAM